jgi:hypothetical protein
MATAIKRIEKEFLLGMLRYKSVPVKCFIAKKEYSFTLQAIDEDLLVFESKNDLSAFQKNMKIDLNFSSQSVLVPIITFSVYICDVADRRLTTTMPEYLYKNLQRSYSRVHQPPELNMVLKKDGFFYDLNYEKVNAADAFALEDPVPDGGTGNNIESLVNINLDWIKQKVSGYKLVLFRNDPPITIEEKAVAKQGKILFISIPDGGFAPGTENSTNLCFSRQSFEAFLAGSGESPAAIQKKNAEMLHRRTAQGISSDCFIPIVFSSYIVGYVHVWVYEGGKEPLTMHMVDKIRQYTTIIAFFLDRKNFFKDGKKPLPAFKPKLLDISVGGFLFALDLNKEKALYTLNDAFSIAITISHRVIHCRAVIIRDYSSKTCAFYGCKFEDMALEDVRFFFESIYGKPFTEKDIEFITGSV